MDLEGPDLGDLEDIYAAMMPIVYRFAVARLGKSDGEDATSEVFHAAVIAIRDGDGHKVTSAWLMAVAKNKVIDRWRKAERRRSSLLLHKPRPEELMTFPANWSCDDRRPGVMLALDQLTPRHRTLLIAHYVDGLTAPQLADMLDISVAAIESALARARGSFRRVYDEEA